MEKKNEYERFLTLWRVTKLCVICAIIINIAELVIIWEREHHKFEKKFIVNDLLGGMLLVHFIYFF